MTDTLQKVLISPAGGQAIYGIINYLKNKNLKVIGIDKNPEAIGKFFVDQFFEVPDVNDPLYMHKIIGIINECKVDAFISWLNPEIIFWNEKFHNSQIPGNLANIFTFNFRKDLMKFFDKFTFYSLLKDAGFHYPKTFLFGDNKNLEIKSPRL